MVDAGASRWSLVIVAICAFHVVCLLFMLTKLFQPASLKKQAYFFNIFFMLLTVLRSHCSVAAMSSSDLPLPFFLIHLTRSAIRTWRASRTTTPSLSSNRRKLYAVVLRKSACLVSDRPLSGIASQPATMRFFRVSSDSRACEGVGLGGGAKARRCSAISSRTRCGDRGGVMLCVAG